MSAKACCAGHWCVKAVRLPKCCAHRCKASVLLRHSQVWIRGVRRRERDAGLNGMRMGERTLTVRRATEVPL